MKRLLLISIAFAVLIAPTIATAKPLRVDRRPAPRAPAPVYTWTGWYVGGNVGYGWGDAKTDLTANGNVVSSAVCIGAGCPGVNIQVPSSFALPLRIQPDQTE